MCCALVEDVALVCPEGGEAFSLWGNVQIGSVCFAMLRLAHFSLLRFLKVGNVQIDSLCLRIFRITLILFIKSQNFILNMVAALTQICGFTVYQQQAKFLPKVDDALTDHKYVDIYYKVVCESDDFSSSLLEGLQKI